MNHLLRAEPLDSENHGQFVQELGELLATTQGRHPDHNVTQGMIDFAEYLQAARTMLPCSQNEFALRIGISEAQLVALEHGIMPRCAISGALLRRIAHTVGEEEEILSLILDGNSATRDRASVAGVLWASSHSARWRRLRPLALLACYLEQ
ncbi:MAG: helix-turn-helix transcriptional regulator, partial [Caldilineaceae bacterium]|nr:helix-turn-helix transcriptional regulator [Caldilineaceae bacterium]